MFKNHCAKVLPKKLQYPNNSLKVLQNKRNEMQEKMFITR